MGSIPREIGDMEQLGEIYLDNNSLTGHVPRDLGSLRELQFIYLHRNRLEGEIPEDLFKLGELKVLSLYENILQGPIRLSFGGTTSLERLELHDNLLGGRLPDALCLQPRLTRVTLSKNDIVGSLPSCLGELHRLREILLEGNELSGTIPERLCHTSSLKQLFLSGNRLTGTLPGCLVGSPGLRNLSVAFNRLHGPLPAEVWHTMEILDLQHNRLTGTVPASLGSVINEFLTLRVAYNHLSCALPHDVAHLESAAGRSISILGGNLFQCWDFGGYRLGGDGLRSVGLMAPSVDPGAASYWCGNSQYWIAFLVQLVGLAVWCAGIGYSWLRGKMDRTTLWTWWRTPQGARLSPAVGAMTQVWCSVCVALAVAWACLAPLYHWGMRSRYTCQYLEEVSLALKMRATPAASMALLGSVVVVLASAAVAPGSSHRPGWLQRALGRASDLLLGATRWNCPGGVRDMGGEGEERLLARSLVEANFSTPNGARPPRRQVDGAVSAAVTWKAWLRRLRRRLGALVCVLAACLLSFVPNIWYAYFGASNRHRHRCALEVVTFQMNDTAKLAMPTILALIKFILRSSVIPRFSAWAIDLLASNTVPANRAQQFKYLRVMITALNAVTLVIVPIVARALGDDRCFASLLCSDAPETRVASDTLNPFCDTAADAPFQDSCCDGTDVGYYCERCTLNRYCDKCGGQQNRTCARQCSRFDRCEKWREESFEYSYKGSSAAFDAHECVSAIVQAYTPVMIQVLGLHVLYAALALLIPLCVSPLPRVMLWVIDIPMYKGRPVHLRGRQLSEADPQKSDYFPPPGDDGATEQQREENFPSECPRNAINPRATDGQDSHLCFPEGVDIHHSDCTDLGNVASPSMQISVGALVTECAAAHIVDCTDSHLSECVSIPSTDGTILVIVECTDTSNTECTDAGIAECTDAGHTGCTDTNNIEYMDVSTAERADKCNIHHNVDCIEIANAECTDTRVPKAAGAECISVSNTRYAYIGKSDASIAEMMNAGQAECTDTSSTEYTDAGIAECTDVGDTECMEAGNAERLDACITECTDDRAPGAAAAHLEASEPQSSHLGNRDERAISQNAQSDVGVVDEIPTSAQPCTWDDWEIAKGVATGHQLLLESFYAYDTFLGRAEITTELQTIFEFVIFNFRHYNYI
eukprot:gene917-1432_t